MMPGESQSRTVPIASDATVGNCQNCSVLHQVGPCFSIFSSRSKSLVLSERTKPVTVF